MYGKYIVFEDVASKTKFDLWILPMFGDRKPYEFLQTQFNEAHARFSPDEKWIAYASDEVGRSEIFVQSFPSGGGKWQISTAGGDQPLWSHDGKELFFVGRDGNLMVSEINENASSFQAGVPTSLFKLRVPSHGITGDRNFLLLTPNDEQFIANTWTANSGSIPITVELNWASQLPH